MSTNRILEWSPGVEPAAVADLVAAAATGDARAWAAIVRRFAGLVWSVARAHRLGEADASDVSQVVWLRLAENLGRIAEPDRLGAWLAAVARNECLMVLGKASRQGVLRADARQDSDSGGVDIDGSALRLLLDARDAALWRALDALPHQCSCLLRVLMADPRPSYEEIAAALDMPIASIGPTQQRCLDRLRHRPALIGITEGSDRLLTVTTKGETA